MARKERDLGLSSPSPPNEIFGGWPCQGTIFLTGRGQRHEPTTIFGGVCARARVGWATLRMMMMMTTIITVLRKTTTRQKIYGVVELLVVSKQNHHCAAATCLAMISVCKQVIASTETRKCRRCSISLGSFFPLRCGKEKKPPHPGVQVHVSCTPYQEAHRYKYPYMSVSIVPIVLEPWVLVLCWYTDQHREDRGEPNGRASSRSKTNNTSGYTGIRTSNDTSLIRQIQDVPIFTQGTVLYRARPLRVRETDVEVDVQSVERLDRPLRDLLLDLFLSCPVLLGGCPRLGPKLWYVGSQREDRSPGRRHFQGLTVDHLPTSPLPPTTYPPLP